MAKVIIQYEAETASLKASVSEINKVNDEVVKSAQDSSKKVADAYKEAGNNAAKAFSGSELNKAFNQQATAVEGLKQALSKLIQEEAKLVAEGKKQTDEFRQNQAELQKVKQGLDEVTKSTTKTSDGVKLLVRNSQDLAKFEDRLRELSIAGDRSSQEFNDLAKAIGEYRAGIIAADRAVDLYAKSTDAATGRIGELEDKLYDLALAGQTNSKEFRELVKEVATVRRAIIETDAQVDSLAQRGRAFSVLSQNVELLATSFQAVEGAQALFGDDSEELQRTLVKLNAIVAITSALEQGRQIILEQLAAKTGLVSAAQKVYTFVTNGATVATKAWRAALVATGVGALIALLGSLASSFLDVGEATEEAAEKAREYQKAIDELNTSVTNAQVKAGNSRIRILVAEGKITEERGKRLEVFNEIQLRTIEANTKAKEAEAEAFTRFEEQKAEDVKSFGSVSKLTQEQLNKDLASIEKARQNDIIQINAEGRLQIVELENKLRDEQLAKDKKAAEEREAIERQRRERLLAFIVEIANLEAEFNKIRDNAIKESQKSLKSLIELTDIQDTSLATSAATRLNFLKQIEITEAANFQNTVNRIIAEGELRKAQAQEIEDPALRASQIRLIEAETQQAIRDEQKKTADQAKKLQDEQLNRIFETAKQVAALFNQLSDLSAQLTENRISGIQEAQRVELAAINNSVATERQKQREREALELRTSRRIAQEKVKQARLDKAIALFGAVVNTAEAITKALPNVVLAGIAGVLGAAQIATIAARPIPKFEKGGAVGGKRHSQGGTLIEAEKDEFVTRRQQYIRHRAEVEAINNSTDSFNRLIEQRYVRPAIERYMLNSARQNLTVRASLNSKSMEKELRTMRKSMGKPVIVNINGKDNRYTWQ